MQLENGEIRKRLYLTDYPNGFMTDAWVEGVGSIEWYGLFNPLINDVTLCGDSYDFACMKEGKTVVYLSNPLCEECFCQLMTSVEDIAFDESNTLTIYPNPFGDQAMINFTLDHSDRVNIEVINSSGVVVANITNMQYPAGEHQLRWNANGLAAGIYIIKLEAGS